jgi:hypothetical protein
MYLNPVENKSIFNGTRPNRLILINKDLEYEIRVEAYNWSENHVYIKLYRPIPLHMKNYRWNVQESPYLLYLNKTNNRMNIGKLKNTNKFIEQVILAKKQVTKNTTPILKIKNGIFNRLNDNQKQALYNIHN